MVAISRGSTRHEEGKLQRRVPIVLWLLGVIPALLIILHTWAIAPLAWERKLLGDVRSVSGFAYAVPLASDWMSQDVLYLSPAQVLEDGRVLGLPNRVLPDIEQKGRGRYALSGGALYFSASDNSDPRTNGHRYELDWPVPLGARLRWASYALALLATLGFGFRRRAGVRRVLARPPLTLVIALFAIPFVISRLWFFTDFPLPRIYPDSGTYFQVVEAMDAGQWPIVAIRPPLFPLLMKLVYSISDRLMAVMLVQNVLSFIGCMCIVCAVHLIQPTLAPGAAMAMAAWTTGLAIEHDTALLSESLYASCLLMAFGCWLLGYRMRRAVPLAVSSGAMGCAILTRPAGMFLLVSYLLVLGLLRWNHHPRRSLVSFAAPMPALLLILCIYNYCTVEVFAPSAFGETNLALATLTFWDQDPTYPSGVNAAIAMATGDLSLTAQDREILRSSWNATALTALFWKGFDGRALGDACRLTALEQGHQAGSRSWSGGDCVDGAPWLRKISLDAIKKHPIQYFRFVASMMITYYSELYDDPMIESVQARAAVLYGEQPYSPERGSRFVTALAKEYATPPALETVSVVRDGDDVEVVLTATPLWGLYGLLEWLRRPVFVRSRVWSALYFIVFALATLKLVASKGRHSGAALLFVLTSAVFGASLVVSLVEIGLSRYSYPMAWVYYLSVALVPLLLTDGDSAPQALNKNGPFEGFFSSLLGAIRLFPSRYE